MINRTVRTIGTMGLPVLIVAMSLMVMNSCSSGGSGGGTQPEAWDTLATLNVEQGAQVPESLLNARGSGGVAQGAISAYATVDASTEVGVFGRIMQDLMYNWLLDLVEDPTAESTGRLFLAFLRDVASDPSVPFAYDTEIDLGVRSLPAGTSGPDGETELDMGTFIITELSTTETQLSWSVPFESLSEAPDGGVYYIRLNLIQQDADTLRVETRMGFQPNDGTGNPMDTMVEPYYEVLDTDGGIYSYNWYDDEANIFQQYTDENGMLRTFFNARVRRDSDEYDLLFLMIGDDSMAGIDSYQYSIKRDGTMVGSPEVQRSFEAYNQSGFLVSQIYYGETNPYRYPVKYLTNNGYALTTDSTDYWFDLAGDDTYDDGTDIGLTNGLSNPIAGAGSVSLHTADTGEYTTWVSGKTFQDEDLRIYAGAEAISGLDSASLVSQVDTALSEWLAEIDAEGQIDVTTDDIITFPTTESEFMGGLGLPLDPDTFPTP